MEKSKQKVERFLQGTVVAANTDKTVAILVERTFRHTLYKKIIRKKKKYLVHDEENRCQIGDIIKIRQVRPLSKQKRWLLVEIVSSKGKNEVSHDTDAN